MNPTKEFKDDPVDFMKNNLVIVYYGTGADETKNRMDKLGSRIVGQTEILILRDRNNETRRAVDKHGNRIPVYYLDKPGYVMGNWIRAYWCPYADDQTYGVMLGRKADYMFTATMNGCTLGLGSPCDDGSILAFHSNVKGHGTEENRNKMEVELAKSGAKPALKPGWYMNESSPTRSRYITTFGVRTKTKWDLYYQIQSHGANGICELVGVTPVSGVTAL